MNAATAHRSPHAPRVAPRPPADPVDDHLRGLPLPPVAPARVRLVAPGDVPHGAVILGHLIAVPDASPVRQLAAVPHQVATVPHQVATVPHQVATVPHQVAAVPTEEPLLECRTGLVLDRRGRRVLDAGRELPLTRREFELLQHLITHPGLVLTRGQLLRSVWGLSDTRYAPARTVDVHVARVRRKLGVHAVALQSLRGVGYRWSPHPGIEG